MIKFIYTLKKDLQQKKIFIWDIGKRATWVFSYLAYRGENVSGFVTEEKSLVGQTFMNRPILSLEEFGKTADSVLVFDTYAESGDWEKVSYYGDIIHYKDALELNPELTQRSHWVYGTTAGAWQMLKAFQQEGIAVKGFLLSKPEPPYEILNLPVRIFQEAELGEQDSVVISAVSENVGCQILNHMLENGYCGDVYITDFISYVDIWGTNPFLMLDDAIKHRKRVLLCCEEEQGRTLLHAMLQMYGLTVSRDVCLKGDAKNNIEDIYSLADEDPEKSVLLIHILRGVRRNEAVQAAEEMGFSAGKNNYAGTRKTCYNRQYLKQRIAYEPDDYIGVSIDYSPVGGKPGWAVYGDESHPDIRIMVLGGSTSSDLYFQENWISRLHRRFRQNGIKTVIYNGAHEMEDVSKELQRMCRDIHYLQPDIVISMSGVNNLKKHGGKFGAWYKETPFEYWVRMETYMKMLAESEGARFLPFLQPINLVMKETSLEETLLFIHDTCKQGGSFCTQSADGDFYYNLMGLFHHRDNMFIDGIHYSEEAHEILAGIVYDIIMDRI